MAQRLKRLPAVQETWVQSLGQEDPLEILPVSLQYSRLENPMDGGARRATVHRVTKSRTRLSDFTFTGITVVKTAHLKGRRHWFDPWLETKISPVLLHGLNIYIYSFFFFF